MCRPSPRRNLREFPPPQKRAVFVERSQRRTKSQSTNGTGTTCRYHIAVAKLAARAVTLCMSKDSGVSREALSAYAGVPCGHAKGRPQPGQKFWPARIVVWQMEQLGRAWVGPAAGTSTVTAQTSATSHPMTVHPRRRFKMKIAPMLRLLRPMMDGRKYNERQMPSAIKWNIDAEILSQTLTKISASTFRPHSNTYESMSYSWPI